MNAGEDVEPLMTSVDKRAFLESLWRLHDEIVTESTRPTLDPGRLMRLTALGINHCLAGVATLLDEDQDRLFLRSPEAMTQLELPFPEAEPDLRGHDRPGKVDE